MAMGACTACILAVAVLFHASMAAKLVPDMEIPSGLQQLGPRRRLLNHLNARMCYETSFDAFLDPSATNAADIDQDGSHYYGSCRTYQFTLTVKNVYKRTINGADEFLEKFYNFTGAITAGNPYACPVGRASPNVTISLLERIVLPVDQATILQRLRTSPLHVRRPLPNDTDICFDQDLTCSLYVSSYCVLNFPTAPTAPFAPGIFAPPPPPPVLGAVDSTVQAPPSNSWWNSDTTDNNLGTSLSLKARCPVTCLACRPEQWQLLRVEYVPDRSSISNMTCCYGNSCNNGSAVFWGQPFDVPPETVTNDKKLSKGAIGGIVAGSVVGAILLALLVGFLVRRKVVATGKQATIDELKIKWSDLIIEGTIGQGGFGDVYKGKWQKHPVAVKMLHNNMRDDLVKECLVMSQLRHPHIARVYGLVDEGDILAMVMHYYKRGTLDMYINSPNYQELTTEQRVFLAVQVARGMTYMHTRQTPLLHGDLKNSNLLLDDDGRVVITDFGLARKYTPEKRTSEGGSSALSINISPPEVIQNPTAPRLAPADVYAFAIVTLEIMSARPVYRGLSGQMVAQAVLEGKRPGIPDDGSVPDNVRSLIERCWAQDPAARPQFKDVLFQIERIHQEFDSFARQDSQRASTFAHGNAPSDATQFADVQPKAFPTY